MSNQRTIQIPQVCEGVGVHSGNNITLQMRPAPPDTGIIFIRTDLKDNPKIPAVINSVVDTRYATTIGQGRVTVSTVEHILAAARGMGIDNLFIDLDGPEVPIMDGSAAPFVRLFRNAKIASQDRKRSYLVVKKPVEVSDGDKVVSLRPLSRPHLRISYSIEYSYPTRMRQSHDVEFSNGTFIREISPARTYGFVHELDALAAMGLIKGGSLENAVVIGKSGVLNSEGLRYHNECVRHKILDSIGDLSLFGMPVIGHLVAHKSGHALNYQLISKTLRDRDSWTVLSSDTVSHLNH